MVSSNHWIFFPWAVRVLLFFPNEFFQIFFTIFSHGVQWRSSVSTLPLPVLLCLFSLLLNTKKRVRMRKEKKTWKPWKYKKNTRKYKGKRGGIFWNFIFLGLFWFAKHVFMFSLTERIENDKKIHWKSWKIHQNDSKNPKHAQIQKNHEKNKGNGRVKFEIKFSSLFWFPKHA